ncbi:MAG TPA: hypothetical protein VIY48_02375, partial [Candidatus Paceibacterota bacterium]
LLGRYEGPIVATLPAASTMTTLVHNIGTNEIIGHVAIEVICTTTNNGWTVGDRINNLIAVATTTNNPSSFSWDSFNLYWPSANGASPWGSVPKGGGNVAPLVSADFSYRGIVNRGW